MSTSITYARIEGDVVLELITIDGEPPLEERFHPTIVAQCVALTEEEVGLVAVGWVRQDDALVPPALAAPRTAPAPKLADLQRQMAALQRQMEAIAATASDQAETSAAL